MSILQRRNRKKMYIDTRWDVISYPLNLNLVKGYIRYEDGTFKLSNPKIKSHYYNILYTFDQCTWIVKNITTCGIYCLELLDNHYWMLTLLDIKELSRNDLPLFYQRTIEAMNAGMLDAPVRITRYEVPYIKHILKK